MPFDASPRVPVSVTPRPFTSAAPQLIEVVAGATVRAALVEAVRTGALPADDLPRTLSATRIVVDGRTLPRDVALDHVLQPGQVAAIDVCGAGGGGGGEKDVGQVLLTLAVIAVSAWVGGPAGAGLGLKSAFLRTVASATVMALGQAAVAGLYAPDREAETKTADRFALQGASNQYRPWAPFPLALGEVVVAPDFAVKTFTRTEGDDVWLHGILGLHYGPCAVSELKIGDTLVSSMGEGDIRIVEHLTPGPRTFTLYPNDVDQLDLQEELVADTASATPVVRAASAEGERFEFDFFLPAGLYFQKDDGRRITASVTLAVKSRPIDANGVPTGDASWSAATSWTLNSTTKEPWRVTRGLSLPLGRYEFDVRRSVRVDTNEKRRDEVAITAIRAIAYRKPIVDETLSLVEFAVRATTLNQGTLAPITCRLIPKCPVWDAAAAGGAGAWTDPVATSNPAAVTRWLMTGPAPARPLAEIEADARLRTWFALCDTHDWAIGVYLTETRSQADVLALLESAGRAGLFWDGAQLAAAPWVEKPAPRQLFTGENLRGHRWQILYPEPVHALRVEFQNLDEGGAADELYVYADGYAETAADGLQAATLIEALRLEGQKRAERAYRDGRWALGQRKLQRRIDSWDTDVEHLASSYGDRVRLSYGRLEEAIGARVRCRRWAGDQVVGLRLSAPVRFAPGQSYAVDLRRADGLDAAVAVINPAADAVVETREIVFAVARSEATSPRAGDLVAFGLAALVSEDVELIGVEPAEGLTARLTAMRYVAPQLMAGETGPIPDLVSRLTRSRMAPPPTPRLLGVQPDPQGVRVSFALPPWTGSPIAGFAARWRPTPAEGEDAGWLTLPPLDPTARTLVTPAPRAVAAALGDVEGETRIDVEIRAFTEAGQSSPEPLTLTGVLVRSDPFTPLGLTVTPATRPAPDGSSHAVLVVALDALAVTEGVDILLECRRNPLAGAPSSWEPAGLALDSRNPAGDVLGLRGGERYGFRAALRTGDGWVSDWTAEVLGTVPAGAVISNDTTHVGGRPTSEVLDQLDDVGEALEAEADRLDDRIDDAEAAIDGVAADLDAQGEALDLRIDEAEATTNRVRAALRDARERLSGELARARVAILSETTVRETAVATEIARIDALLVRMEDAEGGIVAAEALIATLETITVDLENPTSLASQLSVLSSALETLEGSVGADITELNETLTQVVGDVDDLAGQVGVLDEGLADAVEGLTAVATQANELEARADDADDAIADNAAGLATVSQAVATEAAAGLYRSTFGFARTARGAVAVQAEQVLRVTETAAIYTALDTVELGLTGELVALEGTIGDLTSAVLDLETNSVTLTTFNLLEARVTTAEADVDELADDLGAVDGRVTTAEGTIAGHTSLIAGLDVDLTDLGGGVTLLALDLDDVAGRVTDAEGRLDDVEGVAAAIATEVDSLTVRVDTTEGDLDDLDDRQTASEAGIISITQAAATEAAAGLIRSQRAFARTARGAIAVHAEQSLRVTAEEAIYTALDTVELGLTGDLVALEGTLADVVSAVLDLETNSVTLTTFNLLEARVTTAEADVDGLAGDLDAVEASVEELTEVQATADAASVQRAQRASARMARAAAAVLAENVVRVTDTSALAALITALTAVVGDIDADLSITAGAVVDIEEQLREAFFEVIAAAGGDPARLLVRADASGSLIALAASALVLQNVEGDEVFEALKLIGGDAHFGGRIFAGTGVFIDPDDRVIVFDDGTTKTVFGHAFGVGGALRQWSGPSSIALADMTAANGGFTITRSDGTPRVGGLGLMRRLAGTGGDSWDFSGDADARGPSYIAAEIDDAAEVLTDYVDTTADALADDLTDYADAGVTSLRDDLESGVARPLLLEQGAAVRLGASLTAAVQAQSYTIMAGDGEEVAFGTTYPTPPMVLVASLDNLLVGDFGAGDYQVTDPVNVTTTHFTGRARRKNNGSGGTPVSRVDEGSGDRLIDTTQRIYRQKELSGVAADGNYLATFSITTKTPPVGVPPDQEPGTPRTMTVGFYGRRTSGGSWQLLGSRSFTSSTDTFLAETHDVSITGNTDWSTWDVYSGSGEAQYEYKLEVISGYILGQMELVEFAAVTWVENTGASGAVDVTALPSGGKLKYIVFPQSGGSLSAP